MSAAEAAQAAITLLASAKAGQALVLQAEAQALAELPVQDGPDAVLALYCAMSGAPAVVQLLHQLGWTLPGAKGPRKWRPEDIYELVMTTSKPANPLLRAMARERLAQRTTGRPFAGNG